MPDAFIRRIKEQFPSDFEHFIESLNQSSAISIRINQKKFHHPTQQEQILWSNFGYFLKERPSFTLDPIFHSGAYYVQEASSMFLEQAFQQIKAQGNLNVLDLCAAPGGKSTHLLSLLDNSDLLVANEVIRSRVPILEENIRKWGHQNVVISSNDPSDFGKLEGFFDVVVVDAPCSGEGLFRRDASAIEQWSPENTSLCAIRQRRILADIWPTLKNGGYLIYSTCTFNPEENEENLKWLAQNNSIESIRIPVSSFEGIEEATFGGLYGYRFLPHKVKGEGFFLTLIRKNEGKESFSMPKKSRQKPELLPKQFSEVRNWLNSPESEYFFRNDQIFAFPVKKTEQLNSLTDQLRIISAGLPIAQNKKNDLIPEHTLALSVDLNSSAFQSIEIGLQDALLFQKKEEVKLMHQEKGWLLLYFQGVPLGFVKNLGNRTNNYYPKEWRIRMALKETPKPWYLE